jgi:His-Xaa-Ser system protein HxsD
MLSNIRSLFGKVISIPLSENENVKASISIDTTLYSRDAVQRACYWFGNLIHAHISADSKKCLTVTIVPLNSNTKLPEGIVEEFVSEVMDQELRLQIAKETRQIREVIVRRAFTIDEQCVGSTTSHDVDCKK